MTDEEISGVVNSVVALEDQLTQRDLGTINRISVVRNKSQKSSMCTTRILASIVVLKNQLTPNDIKNLYRILAAHGQPPKCSSCGRELTNFRLFSWDHIFARSIGGPNDIKNMTPMCTACNVKKGSRIKEECLCHVESEMLQRLKVKYNIQPEKTKKRKPVKSKVSVLSTNYSDKRKMRRNHIRKPGWCSDCLSFHR